MMKIFSLLGNLILYILFIIESPIWLLIMIIGWIWRAIFGHEDKPQNINLNVTMLGASKSGKTSLLECMLSSMINTFPFLKIQGQSITLKFKSGKMTFKVDFHDFPGEWLDSDSESEKVSALMKKSSVIIIPVSAPFIMEENGKYKDLLKISEIEYLLRNDLLANNSGKLIILTPIMCEKYTKNTSDSQIMFEKITSAYKGVIKDVELYASKLAGKFAVVMIPVNTLGNSEFKEFKIESGNETPECVYSRDSSLQPESHNADQLVKLALIFMLREILRQDDLITDSDSRSDINKLIDAIKDGTKFYSPQNDPLFTEILFGREILTGA